MGHAQVTGSAEPRRAWVPPLGHPAATRPPTLPALPASLPAGGAAVAPGPGLPRPRDLAMRVGEATRLCGSGVVYRFWASDTVLPCGGRQCPGPGPLDACVPCPAGLPRGRPGGPAWLRLRGRVARPSRVVSGCPGHGRARLSAPVSPSCQPPPSDSVHGFPCGSCLLPRQRRPENGLVQRPARPVSSFEEIRVTSPVFAAARRSVPFICCLV